MGSHNRNCVMLGITNVRACVMDGTKSVKETETDIGDGKMSPPFPEDYFDRILLDAPCSGLGQRPQFYNKIKMKELRSFPKIQRKLFSSAIRLLKPGGVLVYSTCTNNSEENEKIVSWAQNTFEDLELQHCQNFGHPQDQHVDSITFFMSKFAKKR